MTFLMPRPFYFNFFPGAYPYVPRETFLYGLSRIKISEIKHSKFAMQCSKKIGHDRHYSPIPEKFGLVKFFSICLPEKISTYWGIQNLTTKYIGFDIKQNKNSDLLKIILRRRAQKNVIK